MLRPERNKKKLKKCCKNKSNLSYNEGDAVEYEVYQCDICESFIYVDIQIQRFWSGAEYVESEV